MLRGRSNHYLNTLLEVRPLAEGAPHCEAHAKIGPFLLSHGCVRSSQLYVFRNRQRVKQVVGLAPRKLQVPLTFMASNIV